MRIPQGLWRVPAVWGLALVLAIGVGACGAAGDGEQDAGHDAGVSDGEDGGGSGDERPDTCDALVSTECLELQRGEGSWVRWVADYPTMQYDDFGTTRTVIRVADLVDAEVADQPENWRYQAYGTDGYTFGGFATWTNMQNGYLELGTRRIMFDPAQELPKSFNVKDAYLIVLSPAGD